MSLANKKKKKRLPKTFGEKEHIIIIYRLG